MSYKGKDLFDYFGDFARRMQKHPTSHEPPPQDNFTDHLVSIQMFDSMTFLKYSAERIKPLSTAAKGRADLV